MAHWSKETQHYANEAVDVAVFSFNQAELDVLVAYLEEAADPSPEPVLTVGDLIVVSRITAMMHDAADWIDGNDDD